MRDPALILIADDNADNLAILQARLTSQGYALITARDGQEALDQAIAHKPDVILLDVMMPKLDGFEVCRRIKADATLPFMPIILVTAKANTSDVVEGFNAGADDYLTKPVDQAALMARLRSILRIKTLQDKVTAQAAELAEWNGKLSTRVASQVTEIERMQELRRFLSPQVADLVLSAGGDKQLQPHRREVTVVFCDLRGFTSFAETAEPEEVMDVLRAYHAALGPIIYRYEGTLERFAGDGLLVFFNDPVPQPNPTERAVRMSIDARAAVLALMTTWSRQGHELGFGIGISQGYATLGRIGFEGRYDYAAIGTVTNLGARLCGEAKSGQIIVTQKVAHAVEAMVDLADLGLVSLKGFQTPVRTQNVIGLKAIG